MCDCAYNDNLPDTWDAESCYYHSSNEPLAYYPCTLCRRTANGESCGLELLTSVLEHGNEAEGKCPAWSCQWDKSGIRTVNNHGILPTDAPVANNNKNV